ncbi:hypothetical protein TNCT_120781 [Trichonephila clavata]|uniref:Uncharacterized protein n=1 Tax=Trichonephila clavata TaxID=2740835 RepID=A0A8X6J600_TRICU|nr:hypothetical protein TNCT_120781 [Trichonephila clavata]
MKVREFVSSIPITYGLCIPSDNKAPREESCFFHNPELPKLNCVKTIYNVLYLASSVLPNPRNCLLSPLTIPTNKKRRSLWHQARESDDVKALSSKQGCNRNIQVFCLKEKVFLYDVREYSLQ